MICISEAYEVELTAHDHAEEPEAAAALAAS